MYWPLSWLAAKGTVLFREHLAAVCMAGLVLWSSALTVRQFWISPKTFADIAVVKWANVHVKPGERAVASARLGAGFRFVVYDLRDVADEQDRVLPSEAIKGDPLISWFFVDNGEWLMWADRRRHADILWCDLAREAVQVTVLPGVKVWRRSTTK